MKALITNLEGVRSLGAVLADERFVCPRRDMVFNVGNFLGSRGSAGFAAFQVRNDYAENL
jgi:hypothetical protein